MLDALLECRGCATHLAGMTRHINDGVELLAGRRREAVRFVAVHTDGSERGTELFRRRLVRRTSRHGPSRRRGRQLRARETACRQGSTGAFLHIQTKLQVIVVKHHIIHPDQCGCLAKCTLAERQNIGTKRT